MSQEYQRIGESEELQVKAEEWIQLLSESDREKFTDLLENIQYCTFKDGIRSCENNITSAYESVEQNICLQKSNLIDLKEKIEMWKLIKLLLNAMVTK